ncbi:MAG: hypothetical protein DWQ44_09060 [Bacteroidetes bacterium]|nr:MAG: hypothetical protein DWQ33_02715 [Bacteroidota bacterium]REK06439.1 MAG: hypothetical protein DWQ39_02850 [Bacteroidota bacterium]REK33205.1 MAG: hypothetical protein DWQ44_09060 [Bacteroidota bacterium]REK47042.1 MAG: hypothetical protein DWQ48_13395 [Bacteroidota bacterium]
MELTEEFLKKITQMGTLGYPPEKIINVLDIEDGDKFIKEFSNKNSKVQKHYQKGVDKADYMIDIKLFEMAKNGVLKALDRYEERKYASLREQKTK